MVEKLTIWSYLEPFMYTPEYLHLADVSQKLEKPHSTVRKYLNSLERQGILTKTVKGRLTLYRINLGNPSIVDYLVIAEKQRLARMRRESLLLNELVSFLHEKLKEDNKVIVFGSAAQGTEKANDIDLVVTGKIGFENDIGKFEKRFGKRIHLINVKDLASIRKALKAEILKSHLIIQGSEEIVAWLISAGARAREEE